MENLLFEDSHDDKRKESRDTGALLPSVIDYRESQDVRHILQPKTVTYASYRLSKIHRAMLVHIREELQSYISRFKDDINVKELITVPLFISHYPTFRNNSNLFMKSIVQMMSKKSNVIVFEWCFNSKLHEELFLWMQRGVSSGSRPVIPKDGMRIQQASAIVVNAVRCENDPGKVIVSINPNVLPFLLYYGPGVGGTVFDRDLSLRLQSSYSARIYELLVDWCTSGSSREVSISELKKLLVLPDSYNVNDIRMRVLDVAKQELDECGCPVIFDYEFKYNSDYGFMTGTRGRYPANCVVFTFNRKDFVDWSELSRKQILVMLQGIADKERYHLCEPLAKQVVENGQDGKLKSKFDYYYKRASSRQITPEQYRNTMLKIVREVTGTDLRSGYHIRNSAKAKRKIQESGNEPRLLFGDE